MSNVNPSEEKATVRFYSSVPEALFHLVLQKYLLYHSL